MISRAAAFFLLLAPQAQGAGFRLATFNIGAHLVVPPDGGPAYFDYGIGAPGQPDHDKVRDVIARINADVVALQEIHTADVNAGNVSILASNLGYTYSYIAPNTNTFDTSLRVIFLSRFPFITTTSIDAPAGFKELSRLHPVVKVDLPGTSKDPTIIGVHLKSGTGSDDRFRRAVEMKRVARYLTSQGITAEDNFIILGDFNPSATNKTFTALPSGLPGSFSLGTDLNFPAIPITYSANPAAYFTNPIPTKLDPRQVNNSAATYNTSVTTGPTYDLFLVSPAIAGRPHSQEIYNSTLDTSNSIGLPKTGAPPAADTSYIASDHYAVFADMEMDQDFPNLGASLSIPSVAENAPPGTVTFSVTLPAISATATTVTISSDDSVTVPTASTTVIPAGSLTGTVSISTSTNFTANDTRPVVFTASAPGYDPANAVLQVIDADGTYRFTAAGQTITENFASFTGGHDPAPWVTSGGDWLAMDDGGNASTGFRAYGTGNDGSLGFIGNSAPGVTTATFANDSAKVLTALKIDFSAEQWRGVSGGSADKLSAELIVNGAPQPLPSLTFDAATHLPTGSITGGTSTAKSTIISGLSVAPASTFDLRLTFTPGMGSGPVPDDVFINEFHYDNAGGDVNEFVEIVIGPGFTEPLNSVKLILYNGADGANYGSSPDLSTFTAGAVTPSGHRIYSKVITTGSASIQNGNPDGFAVTVRGVVRQFISYGGTFAATAGVASGLTSVNIGVTQSNEIAGQASIGYTGSAGSPSGFSWTKFLGIPYTAGHPNTGQTFTYPLQPQGIAIDNLAVTFLTDTDLDGIPDILDPDDDNDGITDASEAIFGSNPLDANSVYRPTIAPSSPTTVTVSFTTLTGRKYTVESSTNLSNWTPGATQSGTGAPVSLPFSNAGPQVFYRVAVGYE